MFTKLIETDLNKLHAIAAADIETEDFRKMVDLLKSEGQELKTSLDREHVLYYFDGMMINYSNGDMGAESLWSRKEHLRQLAKAADVDLTPNNYRNDFDDWDNRMHHMVHDQ